MSWIYPLALALVIVANATWCVRRYLVPWWEQRRKITDWCEVCNKGLTRSSVRELRSDDADDGAEDIPFGGTYMVATYCRKHFPR